MKPRISENIVGHISHFFTMNRPLSILVIVTILLFGLMSFWLLPKQYNPEIVRPAFAITLHYRGATTEMALDRVVYEMVEKIKTVEGVDEIFTTVTDGAVVQATVIFEVGYDATEAKVDLLSQLDQHSYLANGFISQPQVMEINPETIPILHIVFASDGLGIDELRAKVNDLSHSLVDVEDVSEITIAGGYKPALIVEINPEKLSAAKLSVSDVASVLNKSQSRLAGSGVRKSPYQIEMVFDGQAKNPTEIGLLQISQGVLLRDVATIFMGVSGSRSYIFHQNKNGSGEVVTLSLAKVEGSSAPVVATAILSKLEETLKSDLYKSISYQVVNNDGATASSEINGLMSNLVSSILIVTAVLLLFLSTRAALVVLIAIPTTLLVVFGLGFLFDQTINRITLFALILSLGLLVDSAIVVVENIYSHLREWKRAPEGVLRERAIAGAVHEIGVGLILSTATSVVVFLPMRYITGMMGPYMEPIAFFVPMALLVSMMVAIVVVPFVAAHLIDPDEKPNRITNWSNGIMTKVTNIYAKFLAYIFASRNRQGKLLGGVLLLLIISLILPAAGLVHFQMLPKADRNQFYVYIDAPIGTDVETIKKMAEETGNTIIDDINVRSIQYFVATAPMLDFNGMFKGVEGRVAANQATLRVNLESTDEREISSTKVVNKLRNTVAEENKNIAPYVRFMEEPPGPPVQATLVAKFIQQDEKIRNQAAESFAKYINGVTGVVDVDLTIDEPISRVQYTYDYVAGEKFGVSPQAVQQTLSLLGEPQAVGEYLVSEASEYTPIMLGISSESRKSPADISGLKVKNSAGEMIPILTVLNTDTSLRPSAVHLEEATKITYVTAELQDRSIVYVTIEIIKDLLKGDLVGYTVSDWSLFNLTLASETGEEIILSWGGEWEMTLENFRDLGIAMIVALALVYALLAAQYKRFDTPAYILITVPLGLIGIMWGFFILDTFFDIYLTATALIGFIALIGIVVNNAIIYLEYVEQSEESGLSRTDALLAAGSARLRPIVLTSLTTVLGSLTIASDPVWSGLAWSIVFGLSLSTLLTLVVYPTLLVYFTHKNN